MFRCVFSIEIDTHSFCVPRQLFKLLFGYTNNIIIIIVVVVLFYIIHFAQRVKLCTGEMFDVQ